MLKQEYLGNCFCLFMLSFLLLLSSSSNEPEWLLQFPLFWISFLKCPSSCLHPTGHVFSPRYLYHLKPSVLKLWCFKNLFFSHLFTEDSFFLFLITTLNFTTKLLSDVVLVLFCRFVAICHLITFSWTFLLSFTFFPVSVFPHNHVNSSFSLGLRN